MKRCIGPLDLSAAKTFSVRDRHNLVTQDSLLDPQKLPESGWDAPEFGPLCDRITEARRQNGTVILSMGAHVIKRGLGRVLIALAEEGFVTHISCNGASSIHDFELAAFGGTSEHVPTALEDGSFGMWEETGRWMNEAIRAGVAEELGYGFSIAEYIDRNAERFPFRDNSVFWRCWRAGVPVTCHVAVGTDIIHQHPYCDFAAVGAATGLDFRLFCRSVSQLDRGVFMNFGSAVIGPEVFLKALSLARNLGFPTNNITTANFDLLDLGDYKSDLPDTVSDYYYRPRKNIVNRPTRLGGNGWHFCGDHAETLPRLLAGLRERRQSL